MKPRSPITTHILDLQSGRPADGVEVLLDRHDNVGAWVRIASATTDADGRIADLLEEGTLQVATYRLTFELKPYLQTHERPLFFSRAAIEFTIDDPTQHYHVPLLLSPYGYSTYRGS